MDVQPQPSDLATHFVRPIDDFRRLLAFHGLRSGAPQYLAPFARKLEDSKPFRTDLTALLRSTRDLEHGRITSDQMLAVVALAVGGQALLDDPTTSPLTTHTITLVLMLLSGIGGWSDTGDRTVAIAGNANPPEPGPPAKSRFSAAPTPPPAEFPAPIAPAPDVRAFVRSESRPDARPDAHRADTWPRPNPPTQPDLPAAPHTDAHAAPLAPADTSTEPRPTPAHIVRREPLSEVVRTPAAPDPTPPSDRPAFPPQPVLDPTFARTPVARAPIAETPIPEPQRQPAPQPQPDPLPTAAAPSTPRTAASPIPPHVAADPLPAPTSAPASRPETSAAAGHPSPIPTSPADTVPPSAGTHRASRRKIALNPLLATAAVGLLLFGVFEGLHTRHSAPATPAAPPKSPIPAPTTEASNSTPAPEPSPAPLASTAPAAHAAPGAATPVAPSSPTVSPSAKMGSTNIKRATHTASIQTAEDLSPTPTPRSATRPQPTAPPTLARTADLQPPPHGPVAVPEATMNGQLLSTRKPVYPPAALAQNVTGTVVLRAFVSTDGTIRRTDVVTGPPLLVNSALAAASWRRYRPFLFHGRPVEVQTEITYHYITP